MHLHSHLADRVLDFGPVYSFWLFSFERYNGILGEYGTNQRAVEIQLMRKFTSSQFVNDLPLPVAFQSVFKPLLNKLNSKQSGSLHEQSLAEQDHVSRDIIQCSLLSTGPVQTSGEFAKTFHLYTCCGPSTRDTIDEDVLPHLKRCYTTIFNGIDERSITTNFRRYACCKFNGDLFGSHMSRGDRSAFLLARWCKFGGTIDTSGSDLKPRVIDYFMQQNVSVNGHYETCILAAVRWFQAHLSRYSLGAPVEVWCKDLFECEGGASFIPVQRIHGKFIPAIDIFNGEHVLVVCPLARKLQC